MDDYLNNIFRRTDDSIILDDEQKQVVLDDSKYLMVIAGAGSGKTTTMAAKVKYLVEIKHVKAEEIVLISFTNKAVNELKERINNDFEIMCRIATFHSLAFSILKTNGYKVNVLNNSHIIVENFLKKNKKDKKYLKNPQYAIELINLYKNNPIVFHSKTKQTKSFQNLYNYYEEYKKVNKLIDFEDMINKCLELLNEISVKIDYKYIIIDEFQDISLNRYKLIQKIGDISGAKIIAVGDDWQAIFSFAGSDVNLFHEFSKKAKILKITHTYRNSQTLIDIAGSFVMKNDNQIKKDLKSKKRLEHPIMIVRYFNSYKVLIRVLEMIIKEFGLKQKILIISRYNFDIDYYIDNKNIKREGSKIIYAKYQVVDITFMSIHAAKGLGFDNVIILNMNKSEFGFPSLKQTDSFKAMFINNLEGYVYGEERRLFYVAMTRTKNKVYLLYQVGKKSAFIKEIGKYKSIRTKTIF